MKSAVITFAAAVALLHALASPWVTQRTREFMAALLLAMLAASLCACQTAPPPAPVAVQAISLAPIDGEIRRAVRANDDVGAKLERARIALERADRVLAGGKSQK